MLIVNPNWKKLKEVMAELSFPSTEESVSYSTPSYRVKKKFLMRLKEDGETLVIHSNDRDIWINEDAEVFFVTEHYFNAPYVLVNLKKIRKPKLRQLIRQSWIELAGVRLRQQWEGQ
jgi:hypothetical protein